VERLEARDCPALTITNFTATPTTGTFVQITGHVSDDNSSQVGVSFSGVMGGAVTALSNGNFSYLAQAGALGTVYAHATDGQGQSSNTALAQVTASPPSITGLSISYGTGHQVTITGTVNDYSPGGRTVTFSGVVSGSVTTNSDGTFSFAGTASALGTVRVTTTDPWGQSSAPAYVQVTNTAPTISNFTASNEYGTVWILTGTVTDNHAAGLTVQFGGLGQGMTATVQSDGTFSLAITLSPGEQGTITAWVTDWWNATSNTVSDCIG
jgi:hypothetical protein